jgi:ABC-type transporter Mla subunit MlaD
VRRSKDQPGSTKALAGDAAKRIGAIIEAAERAAAGVIDDAEAQARKYLSDTLAETDQLVAERLSAITGVTDSLIAQVEEIRSRSEHLIASLEQVKAQIEANAAQSPPAHPDAAAAEPEARGSHLSAVAPVAEVAEEREEELAQVADRRTPAGARLLATQMAVSGSSREEIEARLRNGFEIDDPGSILDAILGPED